MNEAVRRVLNDREARPFVFVTLVGVLLIVGGQVLGMISPLVYGSGVAAVLIGTTAARATVANAGAAPPEPVQEAAYVEVPLIRLRMWQVVAAGAVLLCALVFLVAG